MADPPPLHEVRLLAVPLRLRARSTEHIEGLLREMELIVGGRVLGLALDVPERLLEINAELAQVYAPQIAAATAVYEAAEARGDEVLAEIAYRVPAAAAEFARRVIEVLDEVDEYCRAGRYLLTLAAPADIAAYRRWSLNEVALQIDGAPPMSWPQYAAAHSLSV
jgi:hypothetical protein